MRTNNQLIDQSDLLATLVEKIETSYCQDISLLICYGSYVTGEYGGMSDIDFFFVPKTDRGYQLNCQFILDDIGYDLWPVSWERLSRLSNLEDQPASILMDGEVLFASSEEDLRRLEDLKNNFKHNLEDEALVGKMSAKYIDKAKAIYFGLQHRASNVFFVDTIRSVEALLTAVALLNGAYTKKGLKRLANELERSGRVPGGFLENYQKMIRTGDKAEAQHILNELIVETEKVWRSKFDPDRENSDPSELAGFYEEFKSTYNKLLLACSEKNYENAYYAAFMIDRETQAFLTGYAEPGIFPDMIHEVLRNDFETLRARCLEHERQLIELLDRNGIGISAFRDSDEFRLYFMKKMT